MRQIRASRRRLYMRLQFVLVLAIMAAFLFSDQIAGWLPWLIFGIVGVYVACFMVIPDLLRRGQAIGAVVYSAEVQVRVNRPRLNGIGVMGVRLLVGKDTIATRALYVPNSVGKAFGWNYTLPAAAFEVDVARTGRLSRATGVAPFGRSFGPGEGVWDESVVLRGPYARSWLELEFFRSPTANPEQVRHALIRAGARPTTS